MPTRRMLHGMLKRFVAYAPLTAGVATCNLNSYLAGTLHIAVQCTTFSSDLRGVIYQKS